MAYIILHSNTFDKEITKMPGDFKIWLNNIENQLVLNPYVGDPINVKWFREKKFGKHRVYYLIYENLKAVYLVGISEKKNQQKIINTIWLFLDDYKTDVENIIKD